MSRIVIAAMAMVVSLGAAHGDDGCGKFAWPLTYEQTLFAAPGKAAVKAGDTLASVPAAAFTLSLQPGDAATFAMPPERKPRAEKWSGGIVRFTPPDKPGIYQVTLSDEAWIDVVQDGHYARSVGSTGRSDCPGVRKSVRFELSASPFILQVSGVTSDAVAVAISPVR